MPARQRLTALPHPPYTPAVRSGQQPQTAEAE